MSTNELVGTAHRSLMTFPARNERAYTRCSNTALLQDRDVQRHFPHLLGSQQERYWVHHSMLSCLGLERLQLPFQIFRMLTGQTRVFRWNTAPGGPVTTHAWRHTQCLETAAVKRTAALRRRDIGFRNAAKDGLLCRKIGIQILHISLRQRCRHTSHHWVSAVT